MKNKLTLEDVQRIREDYKAGFSPPVLSEKHGFSLEMIYRVIKNRVVKYFDPKYDPPPMKKKLRDYTKIIMKLYEDGENKYKIRNILQEKYKACFSLKGVTTLIRRNLEDQ
jgi:pyrroloquinoline quinone (PQQ) biosynthesis protein C